MRRDRDKDTQADDDDATTLCGSLYEAQLPPTRGVLRVTAAPGETDPLGQNPWGHTSAWARRLAALPSSRARPPAHCCPLASIRVTSHPAHNNDLISGLPASSLALNHLLATSRLSGPSTKHSVASRLPAGKARVLCGDRGGLAPCPATQAPSAPPATPVVPLCFGSPTSAAPSAWNALPRTRK